MLELIDRHALPRPGVDVDLAGLNVVPDLLWADRRLVVELDSWGFHSSPEAFEADRRKTADLQRAGYRVLRITWRQVHHDPAWVAARSGRTPMITRCRTMCDAGNWIHLPRMPVKPQMRIVKWSSSRALRWAGRTRRK